jgi:hypothetical protein
MAPGAHRSEEVFAGGLNRTPHNVEPGYLKLFPGGDVRCIGMDDVGALPSAPDSSNKVSSAGLKGEVTDKVAPERELQPASNHLSRRIRNVRLDGGVINVAAAIGRAEIVSSCGQDVDLARVRGESGVDTWLNGKRPKFPSGAKLG